MFGMCSLFLLICTACQRHFASIVHWEQVRPATGKGSPAKGGRKPAARKPRAD